MSSVKFTNPFVRPVRWKRGLDRGFIVFPHSTDVPEGWGDPMVDPLTGEELFPGTEGGTSRNRLMDPKLREVQSDDPEEPDYYGWQSIRSPAFQLVANIDWKGQVISPEDPTQRRYVLSYHGPTQRYWNAGLKFEYGSDTRHREIYRNGKMQSIAPGPVMGAAKYDVWIEDEDTGVYTLYAEKLVAICKQGEDDVAYCRSWEAPVPELAVTDAVREEMSKPWLKSEPDGWREIARYPRYQASPYDAYVPESPWFFSEDGKEARTMRRMQFTFNDYNASVTEDVFVEMKCAFNLTDKKEIAAFTVIPVSVNEGFDYTEWWQKYESTPGNSDYFTSEIACNGNVKIAVDFVGNAPKYMWLVQAASRYHYAQYADATLLPPTNDLPNLITIKIDDSQWLYIGTSVDAPDEVIRIQRARVGSRASYQFDEAEDNMGDGILYYRVAYWTYLHYADIRNSLYVGYVDGFETFYPIYNNRTSASTYSDLRMSHKLTEEGVSSVLAWYQTAQDNWFDYTGWTYTEMYTWPASFSGSWVRKTYGAGYPNPNENGVDHEPDIWTFWDSYLRSAHGDAGRPKRVAEVLLDGELNPIENCVFGTDDHGHSCVHFEFVDPTDGITKPLTRLYPKHFVDGEPVENGGIAEACGYGEKFWPGGVI